MFKVSENKITAVVGAILHQHENYCLIYIYDFFWSLFLDPLKLT